MFPTFAEGGEHVFVAGQEAPPGHYVRVDVLPAREITLRARSPLPPSHDGHVAIYRRIERDWRLDFMAESVEDEMVTGEAQQA